MGIRLSPDKTDAAEGALHLDSVMMSASALILESAVSIELGVELNVGVGLNSVPTPEPGEAR